MVNSEVSASGDPDHHSPSLPIPSNTDYRHPRWPHISSNPKAPSSKPTNIPHSTIHTPQSEDPRQIVVVGVCSAGKSTLVRNLIEKGYTARAVAQEHSYVPHLWQRSKPDVLIYLDASIHTIRQRRKIKWPQSRLDEERHRLSDAREQCDLYIFTDGLSPEDVASRAINFLRSGPRTTGG